MKAEDEQAFREFVTSQMASFAQAGVRDLRGLARGGGRRGQRAGQALPTLAQAGPAANLSEAELLKIAKSIKVADVTNDATRTPAATALKP